eukprot:433884-Lingulodinium_polyedra.AAC.1
MECCEKEKATQNENVEIQATWPACIARKETFETFEIYACAPAHGRGGHRRGYGRLWPCAC